MKQTIFNASLEESMNLVTDKYIKTSLEDFNEKGYGKKILGFFTMQFFLFLFFLLSISLGSKKLQFFSLNIGLINGIVFCLGFIILFSYLNDVRKIKNQSVLSYYYFNKWMYLMITILYTQFLVIGISGAGMILGGILSSVLYTSFFIIFFIGLFQSFQRNTLEILYKQRIYSNPTADFINRFVSFAKKYGGLIMLISIILRIVFPNSDSIQQDGIINSIGKAIIPIFFLPFIYFGYALAVDNFQGYYLQKYLEDYRQLSGYSVEEWYGKDSQRYKKSLNQKDIV